MLDSVVFMAGGADFSTGFNTELMLDSVVAVELVFMAGGAGFSAGLDTGLMLDWVVLTAEGIADMVDLGWGAISKWYALVGYSPGPI